MAPSVAAAPAEPVALVTSCFCSFGSGASAMVESGSHVIIGRSAACICVYQREREIDPNQYLIHIALTDFPW